MTQIIQDNDFTPTHSLNTAVLFLIFNRMETTKQVFEAIRQAKPPRLYIAADGARENSEGEIEKVKSVRDYVLENINWDCEVSTLFRDQNLGCKLAVSDAISWFFQHEEKGIILEDDCLPCQSFFWYCEELLNKYMDDLRIWHIGGCSTISQDMIDNDDSYYLSKYNHIWGWATWASRWDKYDVHLDDLDDFINSSIINTVTSNESLKQLWIKNFEMVKLNKIDTWDYQWYYTVWKNNGLSVLPTLNMISNIGFGAGATHTSNEEDKLSNMKAYDLNLPCKYDGNISQNFVFDKYNAKYLFELTIFKIILMNIKKVVKKFLKVKF